MKLLLICVKCHSIHVIESIGKDTFKFYVRNVLYEGKITLSEKSVELYNVFDYDNRLQCYNCNCLEFNIQTHYN